MQWSIFGSTFQVKKEGKNRNSMMRINPYLTFDGNCREAMTFYQKCLGGELTYQTMEDSPMSEQMPKKMKDCILHFTLTNGALLLMGSDIVAETGLIKGNAIVVSIYCDSEKEIRRYYTKLSAGGQSTYPLEDTFWGALVGGLTDKFGNHWMFHCDKSNYAHYDAPGNSDTKR